MNYRIYQKYFIPDLSSHQICVHVIQYTSTQGMKIFLGMIFTGVQETLSGLKLLSLNAYIGKFC